MKLQVAFDFVDVKRALEILQEIRVFVDIVEVGTPLIIKEGLSAVSRIRKHLPNKTVLADLKIVDAGEYETLLAIKAGADIVTVLGVASDSTIDKALHTAHDLGKEIMVDLIGTNNLEMQCKRLKKLGVDIICVHTPFDMQLTSINPLKDLLVVKDSLRQCATIKIAVAGGLNLKNLDSVLVNKPDIVIVGNSIINNPKMIEVAEKISRKIRESRRH